MTKLFITLLMTLSLLASTAQAGTFLVNSVDAAGNAIKFAVEGTEKAALQEFQPSKIRQWANFIKQNKTKIAITQMKHFPIEAFSFFVALGALAAKDVIFNYSDNPAVVDQFLVSQKDPIGQVAFAAFMMANGYTAQPLMAVVESPRLRGFIPYLGMSVGMFASNIVHEIAHIASMKKCASDLQSTDKNAEKKSDQTCDEAFSVFSKEYFSEKGHEFAPSLVSMLLSTYAAGKTDQLIRAGIIKAGQESAAVRLRLVAVEMAFTFMPGGAFVRGARWVGKLAQIGGFVYLDTLFHDPIVYAWKNAIQIGPELDSLRAEILNKSATPAEKEKHLTEFSKKMKDWRETNMTSVLRAHSNWSYFLTKISAQYSVAKTFYSDFISDIRVKLFENRSGTSILDRQFPLFGIKPNYESKEHFGPLSLPDHYEAVQKRNLLYIGEQIESDFINSTPWMRQLSPQDLTLIQKAAKNIRSERPADIFSGFLHIRRLALFGPNKQVQDYFKLRLNEIGNMEPKMLPGLGYVSNLLESYRLNNMNLEAVSSAGNPLITELSQMLIGPDPEKGEKMVKKNISGFLDKFVGPQIRKPGEMRTYQLHKEPNTNLGSYIFTHQLEINGHKFSGSVFQAFTADAIRPSVLGTRENPTFTKWWEKYSETEYINAWKDYETKYEKIMVDLHKALWSKERSIFNRSTYSNGVFDSLRQERDFYINLLKSLVANKENFEKVNAHLAKQIERMEKMFASIATKDINSKKVVVSTISNMQFRNAFDELLESVDELQSLSLADLQSSQNEKLVSKTVEALKANLNEFANYVQILNAVSYVENHQEGIAKKKRCLTQPATPGSMKFVQAKIQGCDE
ncbi:MAG: hypothetical protein BroJett040_19480 [Oligoflexia bacterium]|nr:MAG: hypothetical protein BroJett040_19480 [Oligoflexia bacterium]